MDRRSKPAALSVGDRGYVAWCLKEGSNWMALGYLMQATGLDPKDALRRLMGMRERLGIRKRWSLPGDVKEVKAFAQADWVAATHYADALFEQGDRVRARLAYQQARELNPGDPGTTRFADHCSARIERLRRR